MTDVTQGLRQPSSVPPPQLVSGYVSTSRPAPAAFGDPAYVVVPEFSLDYSYGPCKWGEIHGASLPQQGADVLLAFDHRGTPIVVWWDGPHS